MAVWVTELLAWLPPTGDGLRGWGGRGAHGGGQAIPSDEGVAG